MEMPVLKLSDGVYLDGNKIEGIKAINIDSSVDKLSEVTLKIVCQVEGVDHIGKMNEPTDACNITTGILPADTITSNGQMDWQVMKQRMIERTELIKLMRKRKAEPENNPTCISNDSVGVHDSEILTELKEINQLIKEYTANAVERDYKMAQLNAYAFNDPKKMPSLVEYYPFLKPNDDRQTPEINISLEIDGIKIGELTTESLSEHHKQVGAWS